MNAHITRAQAAESLDLVRAYIQRHDPDRTALLNEPGHEGDFYSLNVEESGYEAYVLTEAVTWPDGVHAEAVNNCAIGLHPTNVSRETLTDPYTYGTIWEHQNGDMGAVIMNVFRDTAGLAAYRQPDTDMVVFLRGTLPLPQCLPLAAFLTLYRTTDGDTPTPGEHHFARTAGQA